MDKLTKHQEQFLDKLLERHPGACAYGPNHDPRVHEVARPLVDAGWVDRYDDDLADDEGVTQAFGKGTIAYRLNGAVVERFKRTAAEKAEGADLN
jgi:hypothetical protein